MTTAGEVIQMRASSGTGHTLATPAIGSRTMPLTNDDNAEFGAPGLIATVGTRQTTALTKPRRA